MISFNWPIIIVTTVVLYVLTILFLPFNAITATIILFSLIAFWSRLPGMCVMEPARILYKMDFVDLFAVIIAIYVGPLHGAMFALLWNILPWFAGGGWVSIIGVTKDGIAQAIICIFIPFIHTMTGGNLVLTITIFSFLRTPLFFLLCLIIPHRPVFEQLVQVFIGGAAVLVINAFYAKLFGGFLESLLVKGASFSWVLFFIATMVILVFSITVMGFSPKKTGKNIGRQVIKIAKSKTRKKSNKTSDNMDEMKKIKDSL